MPIAPSMLHSMRRLSRIAALVAMVIGSTGLLGWIFGLDLLQRVHPRLVTMKANAAIALILASSALLLLQQETVSGWRRRLAQSLGGLITTLGLVTLSEHLFGWDAGIDQWLFQESLEAAGQSFPGRMGVAPAVVLGLLGLALSSLDTRIAGRHRAASFCFAGIVVTTLVFLYYFYGLGNSEPLAKYFTIALHTVVAFYALCLGVLCARPERGAMCALMGEGMGSVVARWMLPSAVFLPIMLGGLFTLARQEDWVGAGLSTAAFVVLIILVFTALIWITVRELNGIEIQRVQADERLRMSEAEFRAVFAQSPVGKGQTCVKTGRFLRVNAKYCELTGYSAEELADMTAADLSVAEDHEADDNAIGSLLRGENAFYETDRRYVRKDGEIIWVHVNATLLRDGAGRPERTMTVIQDITARKQAAESLRESESLKSAIFQCSLDAIITMDHQGQVADFNPAAEQMFGFAAADIIGQPMAEKIIPERLRARHNAGLARYLAIGEGPVLNQRIEVSALHAQGHEFMIELSISRIGDLEPPMFTATLRDITARLEAETALRESEERFRSMADNISQLAWMADATGWIFWYNQRWFDYTGTTLEEMQGWGWERVHEPQELARMLPFWKKCLASVVAWEDTFPLLSKEGEYRWFLSRAFPIRDEQGNVVRWFGTNTDVHDQRLISEALARAKEQAEAASRAKDDFLAALSHELRTPLTPVLMMAADLERDPALPPEFREQHAMMRRNIELEARLIDDLLDLTRITRGKLTVERVPTDVHQLLNQTAEIVLSDRLGKVVRLTFHLEAISHHALADAARLQQVFWNLLKNALKFTAGGGEITVKTCNDAEGRIIISVTDTGVGISTEALPQIFRAFEQGDVAGQHRYGGLGLGLAISHAIVEVHEGTLTAASAGPGCGACFAVSLASIEVPATVSPAQSGVATTGQPLHFLLVEDHDTTRNVLARLLTRRGHQVTTASSVQEALHAFTTARIDAVISDLGLPDGSGLDLQREIQRQRKVPAIALSGYGMEEDVRRTREAGFFAHLVKPVNLDQLTQLIDQIPHPRHD